SIDGHDKLSRFGFQIYAAIDAYSRFILWCYIGHSNRIAISVNKQFLNTVQELNCIPKLIRSDMGTETLLLCNSQLVFRRSYKPHLEFRKIYSYGTSTRNQRIESWWNLLANAQTDTWRAIFVGYKKDRYFDGGAIDQACFQYIYMDMICEHIHTFVEQHNTHRIRRQRSRSHYLPTGRPTLLYYYPPENVRDYRTAPDPDTLSMLQNEVDTYSLDEYLPACTLTLFAHFLEAGSFPTSFSFEDDHFAAYKFLRERVIYYINKENKQLIIL
ncbi:hypothetical protein BDZ91DRAFT_631770, partial [Kalaharituber pfeilii]